MRNRFVGTILAVTVLLSGCARQIVGAPTRDVNVRNRDASLHVVFKDKACHDLYQKTDRHLQFIGENKENWRTVRVFDAYVE